MPELSNEADRSIANLVDRTLEWLKENPNHPQNEMLVKAMIDGVKLYACHQSLKALLAKLGEKPCQS